MYAFKRPSPESSGVALCYQRASFLVVDWSLSAVEPDPDTRSILCLSYPSMSKVLVISSFIFVLSRSSQGPSMVSTMSISVIATSTYNYLRKESPNTSFPGDYNGERATGQDTEAWGWTWGSGEGSSGKILGQKEEREELGLLGDDLSSPPHTPVDHQKGLHLTTATTDCGEPAADWPPVRAGRC